MKMQRIWETDSLLWYFSDSQIIQTGGDTAVRLGQKGIIRLSQLEYDSEILL